jgi:biotin carboxylase
MNKKIMILGAGVLQVPAIIKAKEIGLDVIAVDMDPKAPGFQYADICLVISTIDIINVVNAAKNLKPDGVMTLASDMPMRTVAAVAKHLNLVGISEETAIFATNKARMREKLFEHGVPIPKFYVVSSYEEYLIAVQKFSDKFIVKPADNSGSRGVFLVTNQNEVETAYGYSEKYSRSGEVVVEDYMQGHEVSVETLTINGVTHVIAITDKLTTGSPNFVEMGHSQPSILDEGIKTEIARIATAAVNAIGIENGPSHTEIMVTKEGPKIVELGARLGGDNITTHLVPLSTGVNMVECSIKIALGMEADFKPKFNKGSAIRYLNSSEGTIVGIERVEEVSSKKGVIEVKFTKKVGEKITNISSSTDRIGYVISQSDTAEVAIDLCTESLDQIDVNIN